MVAADGMRPPKSNHTRQQQAGFAQLLPDRSKSHQHAVLLHLGEHYNMADGLGLTCMKLLARSVELSTPISLVNVL